MAICTWCRQEMHDRVGCSVEVYRDFADGEARRRVPFGEEAPSFGDHRDCPDCLVPRTAFHHPGCDVEQCARCGGQSLTCGCAAEFRPSPDALEAALAGFRAQPGEPSARREPDAWPHGIAPGTLVFTDVWALGDHPVTSVFHWPPGGDPLGWWFFAEELEVSAEILRVTPLEVLLADDAALAPLLTLPPGKKAFREGHSDEWSVRDID